ncbi:MAG: HTH domain-containing protein [Clostridia bacterium]|nr:HTH domain-containing protein [Clostridia bacterium]
MDICFDYKGNKSFRLMNIYERLQHGEHLSKSELASDYSVSEKTIQRDIDDIRAYLSETHIYDRDISIKYDKTLNRYYLQDSSQNTLSGDEVLVLYKILLENCSLPKEKLTELINKISCLLPTADRQIINNDISRNLENYFSVNVLSDITLKVWEFSKYAQNNNILLISYLFPNNGKHYYIVFPVAVIYSKNIFYLIAFTKDNNKFPTVFNINEIASIKQLTSGSIPNTDTEQIESFRDILKDKNSFELKEVKFEFKGNIVWIMSKFPTAELMYEKNKIYTVKTLFCHDSTIEWLKSNNDIISII